jgi:glycosyltransferase involved in cell wall biosynthesis
VPRVTVIIPTYNWSTVLPYSIGSVLAQTYADFELLVIGDGCTDDSEQVVRAIADPRVRWINIARTGHQSGPNNEGLRQARGEWIAYLGHDDLWLPHHLAVLVAAMERGADLAQTLLALVPPPEHNEALTIAALAWRPPSSVMHRRALAQAVGGWRDHRELRATPEGDLWQRVEAAGARIEVVPRLSVIKFPASWRRGVYRERPCAEQAQWLERIRTEPDFEVVELAKFAARQQPRFRDRARRLLARPSHWLAFIWRNRGARIKSMQRYKGVR